MTRLGPRARTALARAVETAARAAGRPVPAAELDRLRRYALDLVETAMIVDTAEAAAAEAAPEGGA